jgi:hypothetical protein
VICLPDRRTDEPPAPRKRGSFLSTPGAAADRRGRAGERPGFRLKIAYNRRVQAAAACSAHHPIEITGAASRSEEPLAAIEHGHSDAVAAHTLGRRRKLTLHQKREAIRRRNRDGEPVREIARSYNVSHSTISRLTA